ncbi:MAG: hypothetical protein K6T61_13955 [Bryobacteraceae bacterium]|nr:hypothetical protein [Bryobacteraceae bacterium]
MRVLPFAICLGLVGPLALPGRQPTAVIPANAPKVELQGRIESVDILRGQGMPSLLVRTPEATTRVFLGSMRYLMERNFNPKAGAEVRVTGYRVGEDVFASQVTLPAENQTLQLRDEAGRPLWIGGRLGRGGQGWGGQGRGGQGRGRGKQ